MTHFNFRAGSWRLAGNQYYTHHGIASLPCGVTVAAAAAAAKLHGGGPELGSSAMTMPTDDQLIAFAKETLQMGEPQ